MRYTNRLLASTALSLLALSTAPAMAQEGSPNENPVVTAYQAYAAAQFAVTDAQTAQDGGTEQFVMQAQEAAKALEEACVEAGTPELEKCLDEFIPADQRLPGDLDALMALTADTSVDGALPMVNGGADGQTEVGTATQTGVQGDPQANAQAVAQSETQTNAQAGTETAASPAQTAVVTAYQAYATALQALTDARATEDGGAAQFLMQAETAKKALTKACSEAGTPDLEKCLNQYVPADQRVPGDLAPLTVEAGASSSGQSASDSAPTTSGAPSADQSTSGTAASSSEPAPAPAEKSKAQQPAAAPQPAPAPDAQTQSSPSSADTSANTDASAQANASTSPSGDANAVSTGDLAAAYKDYAAARADYDAALSAGKDGVAAANKVNGSFARIVSICQELGVSDVVSCLDQYIPADQRIADDTKGVTPPAQPTAEATSETKATPPAEPQVNADGQTLEPVQPDSATPSNEVAPLLDSDKESPQASATGATDQPAADGGTTSTDAAAGGSAQTGNDGAQAAPTSDQEAQANVQKPEMQSANAEQGQPVTNGQASPTTNAAPSNAKVVEQTGPRIVFQFGDQLFVRSRDDERLRYNAEDFKYERLSGDRIRETVDRKDGTKVITIYNKNGDVLHRSLIDTDGNEYVLVYTPKDRQQALLEWQDPAVDLPPLRLNIPVSQYVLDARSANEQQVADFLGQPPVEHVRQLYSVDEVKRSARLRDMVRRLEVSDLTFDFGRATISPDQVGTLTKVAKAMLDLLQRNPAETFLIEGHTDAVGSDVYNLELSDRRAETVANILTQVFGVPPENLATQGYGERYLKVRTQQPARANRRVTIKRITPLVTPVAG